MPVFSSSVWISVLITKTIGSYLLPIISSFNSYFTRCSTHHAKVDIITVIFSATTVYFGRKQRCAFGAWNGLFRPLSKTDWKLQYFKTVECFVRSRTNLTLPVKKKIKKNANRHIFALSSTKSLNFKNLDKKEIYENIIRSSGGLRRRRNLLNKKMCIVLKEYAKR